jgi:hypothetical protein
MRVIFIPITAAEAMRLNAAGFLPAARWALKLAAREKRAASAARGKT